MNRGHSILFRCDGSQEIGLGHVVRCLALADELHQTHNCQVAFAMRQSLLGASMVRERGYPVWEQRDGMETEQIRWLRKVVSVSAAQVLVLDVRDDLPREAVQKLRDSGILIVTLDDPSERRLAADLAFYPPVPQVQKMDWTGFSGQLFVGWEWVVLRQEFAKQPPRALREHPLVLVTMGGSDPAGLTLMAVKALELIDEDFDSIVLLGPGFCHKTELEVLLAKMRRQFDVRLNVQDIPGLMAQADLAVASFGVTVYELAVMGVPAIHLCLTQDHEESAEVFAEADIAMNLGQHRLVTVASLTKAVRFLINERLLRSQMAKQAKQQIDCWGAKRISNIIISAFS